MDRQWIILFTILIFQVACSEKEGAGTSSSLFEPDIDFGATVTGTFVDRPVANLKYQIGSSIFYTNSKGQFECKYGDLITFYFGDLELGNAACGKVVFPTHLTGETEADVEGGAVAMGIIFRSFGSVNGDDAYEMPAGLGVLDFPNDLDLSEYDNSGIAKFYFNILIESADSSLNGNQVISDSIKANYATLASEVKTEIESNMLDDRYRNSTIDLSRFVGNIYHLKTELDEDQSTGGCNIPNVPNLDNSLNNRPTEFAFSISERDINGESLYFINSHPVYDDKVVEKEITLPVSITNLPVSISESFRASVTGSTTYKIARILDFDNSTGTLGGFIRIVEGSRNCVFKVATVDSDPDFYKRPAQLVVSEYGGFPVSSSTTGITVESLVESNTYEREMVIKNDGDQSALFGTTQFTVESNSMDYKGGNFPGTGGTCAMGLLSGETCTILFELTPQSSGLFSNELEIGFNTEVNDGVFEDKVMTFQLGVGTQRAELYMLANGIFTRSGTFDFGGIADSAMSAVQVIEIENFRDIQADNLSISLQNLGIHGTLLGFEGGSYPGDSGDCGATLASGSSCTIAIQMVGASVDIEANDNYSIKVDYDYTAPVDGVVSDSFTVPVMSQVGS